MAGGAEGEEVKLVGAWFSPFVLRVEWALKLKRIQYEYVVEEDLLNKSALLLKHNPIYKKIPVLLHGEKSIVESLLIVEYIDETWKHDPILPQDPHDRAMARFWAKFVDDKLFEPIRSTLALQGEAQENQVKQAKDALEIIERELMGKKFLGYNDKIGLVDIALGWIAIWLTAVEETVSIKILDSEKYPQIVEWMHNFIEFPVIKENVPPRDKVVAFLHNFRQVLLASAATK